ncbi:hypothetical protein AMS68_002430 [Peltaster fructicola]|uniref:Cytochrome P450 n=1 Tax=Peltaster fructicola TaxID=286661 RepID=A0A6H0XQD0_9PEZI|nr:hypothetical protein AMS68_002430 [Peltaster fructicola]
MTGPMAVPIPKTANRMPITSTPAPPHPWMARPAMSMPLLVAPPLMPLPSMNIATARIAGYLRPKTYANWPYRGMLTVLRNGQRLSSLPLIQHTEPTVAFNRTVLPKGTFNYDLQRLHKFYGPIVRFSVSELSFIDSRAWQDIYGHHGGERSFARDTRVYLPSPNGRPTILSASNVDHSRIRRLLSHAFSERALKSQEHYLTTYVDLLIQRLRSRVGTSVSLKDYILRSSFDIAGELEFGESFGCLEKDTSNYWLDIMLVPVKRLVLLSSFLKIAPALAYIAPYCIPKTIREQSLARIKFTSLKVDKRFAAGDNPERPDFMSYVCRHNDEKGMSRDEIIATFDILVSAASETTSTAMISVFHHLLQSPDKMEKLVREIRGAFKDESEINVAGLAALPYLFGVIMEGMRLGPSAPTLLPRLVPEGGAVVCGHLLPARTSVGISQYIINRTASYFSEPDEFIPERWMTLKDGGYAMTAHVPKAFMPFSFGPRVCLGKSLAWAEMRLIIAKVLYTFDVKLDSEPFAWNSQKTFVFWEKKPWTVKMSLAKD